MTSTEAVDFCVCDVVWGDAFGFTAPGLRRPRRHGEGFADSGKGLALSTGADQRINQIDRTGLPPSSRGYGAECDRCDERGKSHETSSFTLNENRASYLAVRESLNR
jgi:hypothetical protein